MIHFSYPELHPISIQFLLDKITYFLPFNSATAAFDASTTNAEKLRFSSDRISSIPFTKVSGKRMDLQQYKFFCVDVDSFIKTAPLFLSMAEIYGYYNPAFCITKCHIYNLLCFNSLSGTLE